MSKLKRSFFSKSKQCKEGGYQKRLVFNQFAYGKNKADAKYFIRYEYGYIIMLYCSRNMINHFLLIALGFKAADFLFSFNLESDVQSLQNQCKIHHLPIIQHQTHYITQIEQSIQFTQDLSKLRVMTVQSSSKDKRLASIKCFF